MHDFNLVGMPCPPRQLIFPLATVVQLGEPHTSLKDVFFMTLFFWYKIYALHFRKNAQNFAHASQVLQTRDCALSGCQKGNAIDQLIHSFVRLSPSPLRFPSHTHTYAHALSSSPSLSIHQPTINGSTCKGSKGGACAVSAPSWWIARLGVASSTRCVIASLQAL